MTPSPRLFVVQASACRFVVQASRLLFSREAAIARSLGRKPQEWNQRKHQPAKRATSLPRFLGLVLLSLLLLLTAAGTPAATTTSPRFLPLDIYLDPHTHPLAAYQFELKTTSGDVTIVGIEGGDHPAYRQAPFYDPAALSQNRAIIAAYSTAPELPTAKSRIARVHVRIAGPTPPEYELKLIVAASNNAKPIDAKLTLTEGAGQ